MSRVNVVRAWKDEEYRNSPTEAERAALPESPAVLVELAEAELGQAAGGSWLIFHPSPMPWFPVPWYTDPMPWFALLW